MSELSELYQEVILDHNKRPRNFQVLEGANRSAEGYNPLCGDQITVYLRLEGNIIQDISFQGSGCAISKASASMMTASLKGKTREEAEELFRSFHDLVTGDRHAEQDPAALGKLTVFSGVSEFPMRVKCASLAWHTLRAALEGGQQTVSTE
jgi:nitrogen fixation NifU-like protein